MKWKIYFFVLLAWTQTFAIAGFEEGMAAYKAKDYANAIKEWTPLALQGNADAQNNLGWLYANGAGVQKDESHAVDWYRKAAERGNVLAQMNLGNMYKDGRGVPKDEKQFVLWYRRAAEQGDAVAQLNLGVMYDNGTGVPKDEKLAVDWYRKAAEQGSAMGKNNLGWMYANGRGVPKDVVLAYMFYNIAAANGNELAIKNRASLEETLSQTQTSKAQSLASAWKPGTPLPKTSRTGKIVAPLKKVTAAVPQPIPRVPKATPVPSDTMASGNCRPKTSHITCQSKCINGDCVVTYANGCKMRVKVDAKFNPFISQWEYPSPSC